MSQRYISHKRRGSESDGSEYSDGSGKSASTAPTIFSVRPTLRHWDTDISEYLAERKAQEADAYTDPSSASVSDDNESILTYASTTPSEADVDEDTEYQVYDEESDDGYYDYEPTALPSTPSEFAEYFPSTRRLCLRHDDTVDGNMNLRVDIEVPAMDGSRVDLTLFHLRMQDLKRRDFSLRRYCRSSGREVCHSSRKYAKSASDRRPTLSRSMGSALASFRPKSSDMKMRTDPSIKRIDSGYDSMSDEEDPGEDNRKGTTPGKIPVPTNTTNIEFSNYAHVGLKRRGTKASKRYEFAYWGRSYTWRRTVRKSNESREITYHLYDSQFPTAVAHIVPAPMTPEEAEKEESMGGWIPPSSMWISDPHSFGWRADVADVIVATGLIALVDDCIKQRWHRSDRFQFPVPIPNLSPKGLNMEYIGPKRLIDEVFHRHGPNSTPRSTKRQVST